MSEPDQRGYERHRPTVTAIADPACVLAPSGEFALVNDHLGTLCGADPVSLVGEPAAEWLPITAATVAAVARGQNDHATGQQHHAFPDGTATVAYDLTPLAGERPAALGVFRDVTERELLSELAGHSSDALCLIGEDGVFRRLSPAAGDVLGYEPSELEGEFAFEYIHPEDRDRVAQEFVAMVHESGSLTKRARYRFDHGANGWRWVESVGSNRPDADLDGYVATVRDITDRIERERELKRYKTLVNAVEDPMFALGPDGRFTLVNDRFCELVDLCRDRLVGATPDVLVETGVISPAAADTWSDAYEYVRAEGNRGTEYEIAASIDGRTRVFEGLITLLARDEERTVNVFRDVTERKARERELREQRDKLTRLESVATGLQPLTRTLAQATTREGLEQAVCSHLADSSAYESALVCGYAAGGDSPGIRAVAGLPGGSADATLREDGDGPIADAMRTGESRVVGDTAASGTLYQHPSDAVAAGHRSAVIVPLTHRSTTYGVLVVNCAEPETPIPQERRILSAFGRLIGHTLAALENRRLLRSNTTVELQFRDAPPSHPLSRAAERAGVGLELEDTTRTGESDHLFHLTVDGDADAARDALSALSGTTLSRTLRAGDDAAGLVQCRYTGPNPVAVLADQGAAVRRARFTPSEATVVAEVAPRADTRTIVEAVRADCPGFDLSSKREHERDDDTAALLAAGPPELWDRLTGRQREVLEAGYHAGYYEWPREITAESLAEALEISSPTLHQHLRKAHATLVSSLIEGTTAT